MQETYAVDSTHVIVETHASGMQQPLGESRPNRVVCTGSGLQQAYLNQMNTFTVNATQAGTFVFLSLTN